MPNKLPSGFVIPADAESKLYRFANEEYDYYDGIPDEHVRGIIPLDVLVTYAVNSRIWAADRVRDIHRGMAGTCDPALDELPNDLELTSSDLVVDSVGRLLARVLPVRWVGLAVATKVLHRKRPLLIPMLDSVLVTHYTGKKEIYGGVNLPRTEQECTAVVRMFRDDLLAAGPLLDPIQHNLESSGFSLTKLRLLEIMIWIEKESNGIYRS